MKGIVQTHVLLHIEKKLNDEFGGLKLLEQFDMFAATSTGSIVSALMLLGITRAIEKFRIILYL